MKDELLPPFSKSYGAKIVRDYRAKSLWGKFAKFVEKVTFGLIKWGAVSVLVFTGVCAGYVDIYLVH